MDPRVKTLIKNLKNKSPEIRQGAAKELGKLQVEDAVKPLIKMAKGNRGFFKRYNTVDQMVAIEMLGALRKASYNNRIPKGDNRAVKLIRNTFERTVAEKEKGVNYKEVENKKTDKYTLMKKIRDECIFSVRFACGLISLAWGSGSALFARLGGAFTLPLGALPGYAILNSSSNVVVEISGIIVAAVGAVAGCWWGALAGCEIAEWLCEHDPFEYLGKKLDKY